MVVAFMRVVCLETYEEVETILLSGLFKILLLSDEGGRFISYPAT